MHTPRSIAIEAALEAGRILRHYFGRLEDVDFKGEIDIVTVADRAVEDAVVERLRGAFPDFAVLAEESGTSEAQNRSTGRWIIDPLDGTTNFANTYPFFGVSIAMERDGRVELGVVYIPLQDELFIAERGCGAWLNGERLKVSASNSLINSVVSTGFQYDPVERVKNLSRFAHFTRETRAVRRDGAAALDLCYVAAGRFDGFWEAGLKPWDVAAASLMITEAGGQITDFEGNEYYINSPSCVATNGIIHSDVLSGVQSAGEGVEVT